MESVLDVYKMPYNEEYPVVCMDESPKQLIKQTRIPIPAKPGSNAREDYEYARNGLVQIFMANEPLKGKRFVEVSQTKTKKSWAHFINELSVKYPLAKKIRLIMDNLNTHTPGALYETFSPDEAKRLWDRYEFIYTPKHGSWLNMAEIELHVLMGQCLNRRIENISIIKEEIETWQEARNNKKATINWQFKTTDARIKLKRLYPTLSN
jgi:transposase